MSQEDKCTETLEGDKIGCIYSVMIKMATTTNVQETTEDRRRQKYRKNNSKLVQLSNLKFSAKVSRKRQVDTDFDREYKAKEAARKRRYRAQRIAALLPSQVTMKMTIIVIMVKMMKKMMMVMQMMIWMNKVKKYIHGHCLTKFSISDFQGSPVILYDAILRHWQICYLYFS